MGLTQLASCPSSRGHPSGQGKTAASETGEQRVHSVRNPKGCLPSETTSSSPPPISSLRWVKRDHSDPSLPLKAPPKRSAQKGSYFLWCKKESQTFPGGLLYLRAKLEPGVEQVRVEPSSFPATLQSWEPDSHCSLPFVSWG